MTKTVSRELVSRSLLLPQGYQKFDWYKEGTVNEHGVYLNDWQSLRNELSRGGQELYLYTQHEIFYAGGILKQTRSSPNWDGGMVTYATCKHNMRTYGKEWKGTWVAGLCPKRCKENCLLFCGRVCQVFDSNYLLSRFLRKEYPDVWKYKRAMINPRGDLYSPHMLLRGEEMYDHRHFKIPLGHTRSTEFYNESPGSVSDREDGKIPKWWRDLEYLQRGRRPPVFILTPCWLFSRPIVWCRGLEPGRAALRITVEDLAKSLMGTQY